MVGGESTFDRTVVENALKWLSWSPVVLPSQEFRQAILMTTRVPLNGLTNHHVLELLHNFVTLDEDLDMFLFAHLSVREHLEVHHL